MSHEDGLPDTARIVLRRRIEWMDTDAAGIYHWTTVFRLAEAAEAALHTALGIAGFTFGATPRVAVQATFAHPLRFNDPVEVALEVTSVGRTSVEYRVAIESDRGTAAQGSVKSCLIDRETGRAIPWPDDIRTALASGGARQVPA
jgi:acyl-CoA thioester hydrolase